MIFQMRFFFFSFFFATPFVQASTDVIYGADNRVDVFESSNLMYVELAASTAAMIKKRDLQEIEDDMVSISGKKMSSMGICESNKYSNQPISADCSGFLVGEKLIATAGHCVRSEWMCSNYAWVFDFKVEDEIQEEVEVSRDNVYTCAKIVTQVLDNWSKDDYALIELDRPVTGRAPLKYRTEGRPEVGDPLVVIGHPIGLPTKIADGANIRSLEGSYFSANLDTFGGNSGSAVFNAQSGVVEGILVRGEKDFVNDPSQDCRVNYEIADWEGIGEDVTYITNIPELKRQLK